MKNAYLLFFLLIFISCEEQVVKLKLRVSPYGHTLVPFQIKDSVFYGIFDTGAESSLIPSMERKQLNINLGNIAKIVVMDDTTTTRKTIPLKISFGNLTLPTPVKLTEYDGKLNSWLLANDVINQINYWYFDYVHGELTISQKELSVDTNNAVVLKFKDKYGQKWCTIYDNSRGLFENVLIDSGMFPLRVALQDTNTLDYTLVLFESLDTVNCRPRLKNVKYEKIYNDSENNLQFTLSNHNSGIVNYRGIQGRFESEIFNDTVRKVDGILSLPYGRGYSYMYLDNVNKKIYLKK